MGKKDKLCAQPTATFFKALKDKEKAKNRAEREKQGLVTLASKPDEFRAEIERLEELETANRLKNPKLVARLTELRNKASAQQAREEREAAGRAVSVDLSRILGRKRPAEDAAGDADAARPAAFAPPLNLNASAAAAQPTGGASAAAAAAPPAQPAPALPPGIAPPSHLAYPAQPVTLHPSVAVRELQPGVVPPAPPPRPAVAPPALTAEVAPAAVPAAPKPIDPKMLRMMPASLHVRRPQPPARPAAPRPAPPRPHAEAPAPTVTVALRPPPGPPARPAAPAGGPPSVSAYASFMDDMADLGAL
jgi:hypothetical protein